MDWKTDRELSYTRCGRCGRRYNGGCVTAKNRKYQPLIRLTYINKEGFWHDAVAELCQDCFMEFLKDATKIEPDGVGDF